MLRKWTWLLPCWVWLWAFKTTGKMLVDLGDKRCEAIRLDDDFVLIRSPLPKRSRTPRAVKAKRRREEKLRRKRERLEKKLSNVNADLRIEKLDEDADWEY